ncbi:MAG: ABC transporter ATP-binding protein [Planctomycetota bacterium]|nr:MAG: ABC transporter ATP-binding protein [Planctomycetota bacterium]
MIQVSDLRVDYDDFCAVRELSINIGAGEVCGLIGPNGAGKTSTMRAIVGLLEPTYGTIRIAGIDAREHPEAAQLALGFMPDFAPVYEDMKCWEFLDIFAAAYKIPKSIRKQRVEQELERVSLTEKRNVPAGALSRGMRQRLTLAKTLLPDPKVLLLDEPASGLDPNARIELKQIIRSLASEGRTVLISSHILSEMSEFCTSVAIMERGRMIVQGSIAEVQAKYNTGTELQIRLLDRAEELRDWLLQREGVRSAEFDESADHLFVKLIGKEEAMMANLLADMCRADFQIISFAPRREGLEELFLKVGAKEVS